MASKLDVETKLAAARTRLILDKPFLGALVLRLPLKEASPAWCRSVATDARHFYYNRGYLDKLSVEQTQFVLAHEALHCALSHFARRGHRVQRRWDLACDFAINPLLVRDGLRPPPEAVVLDLYEGMTAEEIYPCLDDSLDNETLDQHIYDGDEGGQGEQRGGGAQGRQQDGGRGGSAPEAPLGGSGGSRGEDADEGEPAPQPLSAREREDLERQWEQYVAAAANRAQQAGRLSGVMARLVEDRLQPQLPWRSLLAQYFFQNARSDYNYMRPSRREGEMILPSLRSSQCELVIALDTSGSVGEEDLALFVAEINAIKGTLPVRTTLLACDAELASGAPWTFEPWEAFDPPGRLAGGGGTSFRPVFEWVDREHLRPDVLLYFTDAMGEFPDDPPPFPVLWLVKGKAPVPWGRRIQLN
jgi:predicted metal-dependent peptidase